MDQIKLTNGVIINRDSLDFYKGINTGNILFSQFKGGHVDYTPNQDCFVSIAAGSYNHIYVGGVDITGSINNGGYPSEHMQFFPVKKGTRVNTSQGEGGAITVKIFGY